MDRGAWWATVHGIAKSWTQMSVCMHTHTHTHTNTHFLSLENLEGFVRLSTGQIPYCSISGKRETLGEGER